jgi:Tol biopolymer transport system component
VSRILPAVVCLLLFAANASAQPAGTEIHVASLSLDGDSIVVGAPFNITTRAGYDNQPSFTPDGRSILYTSIRDDGQADIYRYEIATRTTVRVTRTSESEYSPTVMPGDTLVSVVRVERDSTQRLWSFDWTGSNPRLLIDGLKPVGYHAWADPGHVALFILGEPHMLQFADLATGVGDTLARDIGRSMHRVPGRASVSFVQKVSETEWWIMELDPATKDMRRIAPTLPAVEDYAWTPDGRIVAAQEGTLHVWRSDPDTAGAGGWSPIHTFESPALQQLTRIAVSPSGDRLAVVTLE